MFVSVYIGSERQIFSFHTFLDASMMSLLEQSIEPVTDSDVSMLNNSKRKSVSQMKMKDKDNVVVVDMDTLPRNTFPFFLIKCLTQWIYIFR